MPQHTLEALSKAYDLVVVASQAVYSASLVSYASEVAVVCPDEVPDELAEEFAQMLRDVTAGDVAIVAPEEGALNADGSLEGSVA